MQACAIIPALNEEETIADVVRAVPRKICQQVIVVDNGSTDATAERAAAAGARVINEPVRGYGRACAAGVNALEVRLRDRCLSRRRWQRLSGVNGFTG